MKLELDPAIEKDLKRRLFAFTVASAISGSLPGPYHSEISTTIADVGHQDAASNGKCGVSPPIPEAGLPARSAGVGGRERSVPVSVHPEW